MLVSKQRIEPPNICPNRISKCRWSDDQILLQKRSMLLTCWQKWLGCLLHIWGTVPRCGVASSLFDWPLSSQLLCLLRKRMAYYSWGSCQRAALPSGMHKSYYQRTDFSRSVAIAIPSNLACSSWCLICPHEKFFLERKWGWFLSVPPEW